MFSSFIIFKRARYTSGASYKRFVLSSPLFPILRGKHLLHDKGHRGRNFGKIACRTKGALKQTKKFFHYKSFLNFQTLGFIGDIQWNSIPYKFFSLFIMSNGLTSFLPTSTEHVPFELFHSIRLKHFFRTPLPLLLAPLKQQKRMIRVSSVTTDTTKGIQYVRSLGSWAIFQAKDETRQIGTIKLPSKSIKLVSLLSVVSCGGIFKTSIRRYWNTKAGFFKNWGYKSLSRGVAKNPVDHPHGGRTKSIRNPRSPWGFTTRSH